MTKEAKNQGAAMGLAALARTLQFEGSAEAKRARVEGAEILDVAAKVRFDQGLTHEQLLARLRGDA